MDVTVIVGTYGDAEWEELAHERAVPSAAAQGVKVIQHHHRTLAAARNEGARWAESEWLCFLDADDELDPGYFAAMAQARADLRGPAVAYVRPGGMRQRPKLWPVQDLRDGNYLVIGTLVRRQMFLSAGGFRDFEWCEDWDLWQRCWKLGASIELVPDAVYVAHVRPDSRNRGISREETERIGHAIRRANFPELYQEAA